MTGERMVTVLASDVETAVECWDYITMPNDARDRLAAALAVPEGDTQDEAERAKAIAFLNRNLGRAAASASVGEAQDAQKPEVCPTCCRVESALAAMEREADIQERSGQPLWNERAHAMHYVVRQIRAAVSSPAPTSDGLRDDREALAKAAYEAWVGQRTDFYRWDELPEKHREGQTEWLRVADAVLPVVEAAVTTATETLRESRDTVRLRWADTRAELDAARGEVAAARTALTQIAALCDSADTNGEGWLTSRLIRALLPTQGETK